MTDSEIEKIFLPLLKRIVALWLEQDFLPGESSHPLRDFLAEEFDRMDFLNRVRGISEITTFGIHVNNVAIEFIDVDGGLQRAIFKCVGEREWRLQSLKFQCPICFGVGENDGAVCSGCDGVGWAPALDEEATPAAVFAVEMN